MKYAIALIWCALAQFGYTEEGSSIPATPLPTSEPVAITIPLQEVKPETPSIFLVNPGAEVLIYVINDPVLFQRFNNMPVELAGMILGCFQPIVDAFPHPRIVLLGHWSKEIEVAMHELCHYMEWQVPDRRCEIREAFRKLATPDFQILAGDLQDHVGHNGKPNPIIMGIPTDEE